MSKVYSESLHPDTKGQIDLIHDGTRDSCCATMNKIAEHATNTGCTVRGTALELTITHPDKSPCAVVWVEFSKALLKEGEQMLAPFWAKGGLKPPTKDGPKRD